MKKDMESPLWDYYLVPTERSDNWFYVKRISKKQKIKIQHGGKSGGMFSKPDPIEIEDPNVEWWNRTHYEQDCSGIRHVMFDNEYQMSKSRFYNSKESFDEETCEEAIRQSIEWDIKQQKGNELESQYEQRKEKLTRKVPPYKKLKKVSEKSK